MDSPYHETLTVVYEARGHSLDRAKLPILCDPENGFHTHFA